MRLASRRFGALFMGVGVVAAVYHSSAGRLRTVTRKMDYWSIGFAAMQLRRAVWGAEHPVLRAAAMAAIMFKPTLISGANFMAVEVRPAFRRERWWAGGGEEGGGEKIR